MEGSRPLLVEVQALVDPVQGGVARRLAVGLDPQRLALLLAVLHRHGGVETGQFDVFVNAVGGVRIGEPAADLAVLAAVYSSLKNIALSNKSLVFGEVGLAGEIRPVQRGQERLREAAKLGFRRALIPLANRPKQAIEGIEIVTVARVADALEQLLDVRTASLSRTARPGMRAMVLDAPGATVATVAAAAAGTRVPGQVAHCGAACRRCRTDLHLVDGELPDPALPIVPGHEIVARGCRPRGRCHRTRGRCARRRTLARQHLRPLRLLHHGPGESLCRGALHRLPD